MRERKFALSFAMDRERELAFAHSRRSAFTRRLVDLTTIIAAMLPDPPPRALSERTGKHFCVRCLAAVAAEEYLRNDYLCEACAASDEYPLASTPEPKMPEPKNDER